MRAIARGVAAVVVLAASAGVGRAHGLAASEFTAPVPLALVLLGGGVTVAVTALWLWRGDPTALDAGSHDVASVPRTLCRPVETAVRVAALALFVAALAHGLFGRAVPAENLATLVVWPLLLKGLGIVAVVAGSPWRVVSPWETLYDLLVALEGRAVALVGPYPAWLGSWPAVAGFVAGVGVLENLTVVARSPSGTVAVASAYAAIMLVGAVAFGREWFARADALAVLFDLLGRVSVLEWRRSDDRLTLAVRPPWAGATAPLADRSLVVFVVATVYTVSFDGFAATRAYRTLLFDARAVVGVGPASLALYGVGLAAFVAVFLATAALVDRSGARTPDRGESARALAGTVVPIAAAYEVAHNYPFVAANFGGALTLARDALLEAAGAAITPLGWLSVQAFWTSQVALVVGGHVVAVVAAHRVARRRYGDAAGRAHAPLAALMVGYTTLSLWIVSQPVAP